ncbi:MAG TPA: choice-of-anchor J domain-containing protein [Melioribacteraceae bacterium]|nr:choice-of-anchor J domain-containing protein [Melioribacteraceae bacterium]
MKPLTNKVNYLIIFIVCTLNLAAQVRDIKSTSTKQSVAKINDFEKMSLQSYLYESFEGEFPPAGWINLDLEGGTGWAQQTTGTYPVPGWTIGTIIPTPDSMGGNKMAFCTYNTGDGAFKNDQWLITPQITNILPNSVLIFWLRKLSNFYIDTLKINISTTDNQPTSFTNLRTLGFAASDSGWNKYVIDLNPYKDSNLYLAFQEVLSDNVNYGDAFFLDLVQITDEYTSVENDPNNLPNYCTLNQNFPNPFNPTTNISFSIPKLCYVTFKVFDILGKEVITLINEELNAGNYTKTFDATNLGSGVYFYKLQAGNFSETKKMILMR